MSEQRQCHEAKLARTLVATLQILTRSERARHGKGGCPQEYDEWSRHCVTADIFAAELTMNEGHEIPYDRTEEICKFANNLRLQRLFEEVV